MGLRNGCYAQLWSAKKIGKIYSCQASVSQKNKDTGAYTTLFSGFVNFAGKAAEAVEGLGLPENVEREHMERRNVKITGSPDISTYVKDGEYKQSITIWDIEIPDDNGGKNANKKTSVKSKSKPKVEDDEDEDEDLPF